MNASRSRRFRKTTGATVLAAALLAPATAGASQNYIVTLQPATGITCETTIRDVSLAYAISPKSTYTSSLCGFAASLSKRTVEALQLDSRVKSVTADGAVTSY